MEGLGVAASVIAVVDISFKVFKTCRNYAHQVKHAESDISRLITVVENLNLVAQSARDLLDSPYGEQLKISDNLPSALKDSKTLLTDLDKLLSTKVNGEKKKSIKAWIWPFECNVQGFSARKWPFKRKDQGFGALEWPFRRQEVDELISNFQQYYDAIETALSIIQTFVLIAPHSRMRN